MAKTVVGLFDDFSDAQAALRDLTDAGIPRDDISLVANDVASRAAGYDDDVIDGGNAAAGAAAGATGGAVLGGVGGLLLGLGAFAIPGLGPLVAAGPIVAALTGAGVGAAAGGLIGGLTGAGVPEEAAGYYAEGVRRGGVLLTVRADEALAGTAANIMHDHDVVNIDERAGQWKQSGWSGYNPNAAEYSADDINRERTQYRTPAYAQNATLEREPRSQTPLYSDSSEDPITISDDGGGVQYEGMGRTGRTVAGNAEARTESALGGNGIPGIQTGGHNADGSPDTRGIFEKTEDAITGDQYDDKTGRKVA